MAGNSTEHTTLYSTEDRPSSDDNSGSDSQDERLEMMDELVNLNDDDRESARGRLKRRASVDSDASCDNSSKRQKTEENDFSHNNQSASDRDNNRSNSNGDSSDDDVESDVEWTPPDEEPSDISVSDDAASNDPDYIVHIPKTVQQLLEEYDSTASDDSWRP